jgi:hypothetical protein
MQRESGSLETASTATFFLDKFDIDIVLRLVLAAARPFSLPNRTSGGLD